MVKVLRNIRFVLYDMFVITERKVIVYYATRLKNNEVSQQGLSLRPELQAMAVTSQVEVLRCYSATFQLLFSQVVYEIFCHKRIRNKIFDYAKLHFAHRVFLSYMLTNYASS